MPDMISRIKDEMRYSLRKRGFIPKRPDPLSLWEATNEDGPLALFLMLEYDLAAREVRQERADRKEDRRAA